MSSLCAVPRPASKGKVLHCGNQGQRAVWSLRLVFNLRNCFCKRLATACVNSHCVEITLVTREAYHWCPCLGDSRQLQSSNTAYIHMCRAQCACAWTHCSLLKSQLAYMLSFHHDCRHSTGQPEVERCRRWWVSVCNQISSSTHASKRTLTLCQWALLICQTRRGQLGRVQRLQSENPCAKKRPDFCG